MNRWIAGWCVSFAVAGGSFAVTTDLPMAPTLPKEVKGKEGVKAYLVAVCKSALAGANDLRKAADEYEQVCKSAGSPSAAATSDPQKVAELITTLRHDYQRVDSFGYEYMEGIVAGVPSLMHYDVELDSGVPRKEASGTQDQIAPVVIHAGSLTLDHEGSLNNYLIEPTVFGTNPRFIDGSVMLPGFEKKVNLPNPALIVALAAYAQDGYTRLSNDAQAWQPTDADCYHAIYSMTPTLADYFDEWKESKKFGGAMGGRFVAVSRVSDMRGIMSSTQLTWEGVADQIHSKDSALAANISNGYVQVLQFIDTIDARDQKSPLNVETIDFLGTQAKERADKLTIQTAQAAALVGVEVNR